jgi:hypothetical protein
MRQTIEDLEALRDLNDELEENHLEAEKQLNSEIGKLWQSHGRPKLIKRCSDSSAPGRETTIVRPGYPGPRYGSHISTIPRSGGESPEVSTSKRWEIQADLVARLSRFRRYKLVRSLIPPRPARRRSRS